MAHHTPEVLVKRDIMAHHIHLRYWPNLVKRDIMAHHTPEAVDECREGDSTRSIAIPLDLWARAREIKNSTSLQPKITQQFHVCIQEQLA